MAKFLNEVGVEYLVQQLVGIMEQKITVKMVTSLDENSTNAQIAGAKAVYEFVLGAIANKVHLTFEPVDELPLEGETDVIYLVSEGAGVYGQHLYFNGAWYALGSTDMDLSNYWSKSELQAMTNLEIQDVVDTVMGV